MRRVCRQPRTEVSALLDRRAPPNPGDIRGRTARFSPRCRGLCLGQNLPMARPWAVGIRAEPEHLCVLRGGVSRFEGAPWDFREQVAVA